MRKVTIEFTMISLESTISKLILDSSTMILKTIEMPLFEKYRTKVIKKWLKFYKFVHRTDKSRPEGARSLHKSMIRKFEKSLAHISNSSKHLKKIKHYLRLTFNTKENYKFYKNEKRVYDELSNFLGEPFVN